VRGTDRLGLGSTNHVDRSGRKGGWPGRRRRGRIDAPGSILADRYRITGLLGRGGMGEVYRADDLKLGQPVTLKFIPKGLSDDPVRRERFHAKVRIARQVSHPHICRVYDIGEMEGRHFLTMEYVDGEHLASLLKRIGRPASLPPPPPTRHVEDSVHNLGGRNRRGPFLLHAQVRERRRRERRMAGVDLVENRLRQFPSS
jgi:serine/threonine protein kinase